MTKITIYQLLFVKFSVMKSLKKTHNYMRVETLESRTFVQNINTTSVRKVLALVLKINILALEF